MKLFYDTKCIIVHILKNSGFRGLSAHRLHDVLGHLYDELRLRGKLDEYDIFYDIDSGSLERTILYNRDWFWFDEDEQRICLKQDVSVDKLAERYPLDDVVSSILYGYCLKYYNDRGGADNEEDNISRRNTRRCHLLGCIRRFLRA